MSKHSSQIDMLQKNFTESVDGRTQKIPRENSDNSRDEWIGRSLHFGNVSLSLLSLTEVLSEFYRQCKMKL